jgi:hypothetical protein
MQKILTLKYLYITNNTNFLTLFRVDQVAYSIEITIILKNNEKILTPKCIHIIMNALSLNRQVILIPILSSCNKTV